MSDLKTALGGLNIPIDDVNLRRFSEFEGLLLEWNKKMNLTAITDSFGIMTKHFLDSLLPLTVFDIPQGARMIDVGTGAGFPGVPIKLARADISITLLDSLNKRIHFLDHVIAELELDGICAVHGRAEELGRLSEWRETFDVATSRAVATLDMLSEFCLPFVKVGGVFLVLKSADSDDEIEAAKPIIAELGGKIEDEFSAEVPYTDITRKIVVVRKVSPTPERFPRSMKKIRRGG
ncbi:MAG: 16S rRNA (guanine(527)-N(7))-methyltransferase RsmG [Oscillospiraceae bacterium]|nr:16S rRNA (guanine(527)-N(7))-methyltransferase RsmG [Oscillospiraceae bacterium]